MEILITHPDLEDKYWKYAEKNEAEELAVLFLLHTLRV